MPNEFDDKKYETTDGENPYTDNFSEPPEQNETVREQTQNAQPEPSAETTNFIPYDQYTGGNPYTDKKEQPNPYSAHSEPFSYSPYSGGKAENDKFTPIDYNSRGAQTKSKNNGIIIFLTILIVVFALAAAAFGGMYFLGRPSENKISGKAETGAVNSGPALAINSKPASDDNVSESSDGKLTVTQIAKKVRPSVVGIVAYSSQSSLENFGQSSASSGSGVIMSSDGYIITNAHVIEGAARIEVVLDNGDECEGKLIGSDSKTDLAVVKINKKNLTVAEFGDSSQTQVGEDVIAIGNPAGLELAGSLTRGIVSAVERPVQSSSSSYTMNCIQTDAAINPGNSGGALVNMYGQVIGINSSKIAQVDYEGIGFAISSNDVKPVIDDLIKYSYVKGRAKIGITYEPISSVYAAYRGVPTGLYVDSVDETLDVYAKGLRVGDIITKIDGKEINDSKSVTDYLKNKKAGDKIKLTVFRYSASGASRTMTLNVTLAEDKGDDASYSSQNRNQNNNNNNNNNGGDDIFSGFGLY